MGVRLKFKKGSGKEEKKRALIWTTKKTILFPPNSLKLLRTAKTLREIKKGNDDMSKSTSELTTGNGTNSSNVAPQPENRTSNSALEKKFCPACRGLVPRSGPCPCGKTIGKNVY
jgi:hypothetical protein